MCPEKNIVTACMIIFIVLVCSVNVPSAAEGPDVVELDSIGAIYGPVTFDHALHMDIASCPTCHHHTAGMPTEDENCVKCHTDTCSTCEVACKECHSACPGCAEKLEESRQAHLYHIDAAGLKRAYHVMCLGCHREMDTITGCLDCHLKNDES